MNEEYCELILNDKGTIESTDSAKDTIRTIEQQIQFDKRYGNFTPRNGKYFTFKVYSGDKEISHKTVVKAVHYAFKGWTIRTKIKVKRARKNELPDFRIYFRTVAEDPLLKKNTIMYHYYPISDVNNPKRGVCVINADFYYTVHGNPISMHEIDPDNYPEDTKITGKTMDIDAIIRHEFGHGFGLPHDEKSPTVMYYSAGGMAEFPAPRDIARIQAKLGVSTLSKYRVFRWMLWLRYRSDNY